MTEKIRTESFRESLGMRLRGAYLSMHRFFNDHFGQFGSTADQYVLLTVLSEEDGVTQQDLAQRIYSDQNTIAAMLALLEKRGLVRRKTHPNDGRARCVYLTAKGRAHQEELDSSAKPLHRQLREILSLEEKAAVLKGLKQITEAIATPDARSRSLARRRSTVKPSDRSKSARRQPAEG